MWLLIDWCIDMCWHLKIKYYKKYYYLCRSHVEKKNQNIFLITYPKIDLYIQTFKYHIFDFRVVSGKSIAHWLEDVMLRNDYCDFCSAYPRYIAACFRLTTIPLYTNTALSRSRNKFRQKWRCFSLQENNFQICH